MQLHGSELKKGVVIERGASTPVTPVLFQDAPMVPATWVP